MTTLIAEVQVPYSRAVCHEPAHPKQRCAIGRTAFGPGQFAYLHKVRAEPVETVDCPQLVKPLYDLGRAFVGLADKGGYQLEGYLYVDGPYPDYGEADHSSFRTGATGLSPNHAQEAILAASGIVTDRVRYRLYGRFTGKETPCPDSGEQTISEASEEFLVSTP